MKMAALVNIFDCLDKAVLHCARLPDDADDADGMSCAASVEDSVTDILADIEIYLDENMDKLGPLQSKVNMIKNRKTL